MPRKKKSLYIYNSHGIRKYDNLCSNVFDIDSNIRFAAVYDKDFNLKAGGIRKGITSYFNKEQLRESILQQFKGWETFMIVRKQVGEPQYSMTKYDKAILTTFFLNIDELFFVSLEPVSAFDNTIKRIQYHVMNLK